LKFRQLSVLLPLVAANAASATDLTSDLYGKFNVSRDFLEARDDIWLSNASRIGIRGNYQISEPVQIVYQLEQDVDLMHGGTNVDTLFSMRNTFIGFKANMGRVIFGAHDSPLKMSQGKVDQFNDTLGDVKDNFVGEVRATDSYMYNSRRFGTGIQFNGMYVPSDSNFDAGQSYSMTYQQENLYLAAAYDAHMRKNDRSASKTRAYDSYRLVAQYIWGDVKIGALNQSSEPQNTQGAEWQEAVVFSGAYKYQNFTFRAQLSDSDIVLEDFQLISLGVDYHLNKQVRLYVNGYDRKVSSDSLGAIEIGGEYKF
jgi:predicted porin